MLGVSPSCSVTQSHLILCNPLGCSMPGFPVLHCLPECVQTHAHWASDAIQPSHSRSPPSPSALNLFQNQDLFQWVSSSRQVVQVLQPTSKGEWKTPGYRLPTQVSRHFVRVVQGTNSSANHLWDQQWEFGRSLPGLVMKERKWKWSCSVVSDSLRPHRL